MWKYKILSLSLNYSTAAMWARAEHNFSDAYQLTFPAGDQYIDSIGTQ